MAVNNWKNGGVDHNYGTAGNWSTGSVPTAIDGNVATFPAGTGWTCTVAVAAVANHLDFTNADIAITWTNSITVSGNVTGPSSTLTGSGAGGIVSATAGTWTAGTTVFTQPVTRTGTITFTTSGEWKNSGLVTVGASTLTTTLTGSSWTISGGGLHVGGTTSTVTGTTTFKLTGGTFDSTQTGAGAITNNIEFAGNSTFSGTVRYKTGTILYTSGTITVAGSTLLIQAAATLNTNGMTWNNINIATASSTALSSALQTTDLTTAVTGTTTFTGAFPITTVTMSAIGVSPVWALSGNITASGLFSEVATTTFTWSGAFDIRCGSCTMSGTKTFTIPSGRVFTVDGLFTSSDANVITATGGSVMHVGGITTTGAVTGTQKIDCTGGNWTGAAGALSNSLDLNGTITISGTVLYAASGTPTLTWLSGVVTTTGSTLSIGSSCTLNTPTANMSWANITLTAAATLTLTAAINGNTLTYPDAAVTIDTSGSTFVNWATATLTVTRITTLKEGVTHRIKTNFSNTITGANTIRWTITSAHASTKAIITLDPGAEQSLLYVDPTRIDSSGGREVFSDRGTITTSINWTNSIQALLASQGRNPINGMIVAR